MVASAPCRAAQDGQRVCTCGGNGPSAGARGPGGQGGAGRVVAVEAAPVRQMALRDDAEAVGSLRSRRSVVLRPEVSGRITQLNFTDGQRVRQGQVLVQFDDQLPRAQVQQSQAELSIAQANHKRNQELVAQGFISQRSVDESAANLEVAQAKLSLSQATASRLRILAPFDGIAGIRGVNVGDYLKDGADIVNVEDLDAVYVDFRLPERLQGKVRTGQTARVVFDALPGVRYAAVVQAINPQIDADGRAVAVRGCIDNRRLQLRPGMFARVTTVFSERANARVVPEEAIVPEGSNAFVYKVIEGKEPGTRVAQRTAVTLGARALAWWRWWTAWPPTTWSSPQGSSVSSATVPPCAWWCWASRRLAKAKALPPGRHAQRRVRLRRLPPWPMRRRPPHFPWASPQLRPPSLHRHPLRRRSPPWWSHCPAPTPARWQAPLRAARHPWCRASPPERPAAPFTAPC